MRGSYGSGEITIPENPSTEKKRASLTSITIRRYVELVKWMEPWPWVKISRTAVDSNQHFVKVEKGTSNLLCMVLLTNARSGLHGFGKRYSSATVPVSAEVVPTRKLGFLRPVDRFVETQNRLKLARTAVKCDVVQFGPFSNWYNRSTWKEFIPQIPCPFDNWALSVCCIGGHGWRTWLVKMFADSC